MAVMAVTNLTLLLAGLGLTYDSMELEDDGLLETDSSRDDQVG